MNKFLAYWDFIKIVEYKKTVFYKRMMIDWFLLIIWVGNGRQRLSTFEIRVSRPCIIKFQDNVTIERDFNFNFLGCTYFYFLLILCALETC